MSCQDLNLNLSGAEIDMSICLMVSNPINENEKCIYVPVSTERVFENYWLLAIEKLDLKWVRCFQCGIEIGKDELEPVKMELTELKNWLVEHMNNEQGVYIRDRIDNLCMEMNQIFSKEREDIKLYIG